MSSFADRLRHAQTSKDSALCVGLDPDPSRLPADVLEVDALGDAVVAFCRQIIDATAPYACAYKVNFAFFEALGVTGAAALARTVAQIPDDCVTIADAKRGDIGNSARFYARSIFDDLGFDACTVSPYMGRDSVTPFLDYADKGVFVLARTSNPGAADLQEACTCDGTPLYLHTADLVQRWTDASDGQGGLVVGATAPPALRELRERCPALPFLVPGVGAQGGSPEDVMAAAATDTGRVLVNSSRSILFAVEDDAAPDDFADAAPDDFADAAADAARRLRDALRG